MSHQMNALRIKIVAEALIPLKQKIVFVGGATVSLYPDRKTFEVRITEDVDVLIEILNYSERATLEENLRSIGFSNDTSSKIICRYRIKGIIVDIMPTNDPSIGFSNKWYPQGFNEAMEYTIDENCRIYILTAPFFLATKLEAHLSRGADDPRLSKDLEDIVYVLENRQLIWKEMNETKGELKMYLKEEFLRLVDHPSINEWIGCHVERASPPATLRIIDQLKKFTYHF
jgi:predicted nucleotidyltransferase